MTGIIQDDVHHPRHSVGHLIRNPKQLAPKSRDPESSSG